MRDSEKLVRIFLTLATTLLLLNANIVRNVAAPPSGDALHAGIMLSSSQIDITHAEINMTIHLDQSLLNQFVYSIQIDGKIEMLNTGEDSASIMHLYSSRWDGWMATPINSTGYEVKIEGQTISNETNLLVNITHPSELPHPFPDYFPSWIVHHEAIWYSPNTFALTNLSLSSHERIVLHFCDSLIWTTYDFDQYAIGFCFMPDRLNADGTTIDCQIRTIAGIPFHHVRFYPEDGLTSTQNEYEQLGEWSVAPPFSSSLLYNIGPDPVRAGFQVLLVQRQYIPLVPTTSQSTIPSTSTTPLIHSQPTIIGVFIIVVSTVVAVVVLISLLKRWE